MQEVISILREEDVEKLKQLVMIYKEVFEMEAEKLPSDEYFQILLGKSDFLVLVAELEGRVIGGLTAYILHSYHREIPQVYIYDFGVSTAYQRQGIGRALINYLRGYCSDKEYGELFVQAELEDDHAIAFYRNTGPSKEGEALFFTYEIL
jgi:Acetyltransferases